MSKEYDCTEAAAYVAMSDGSERAVREALTIATDIPADRMDKAVGEIMQSHAPLAQMAAMLPILLGRPATHRDVAMAINGFRWIDDDAGTAQYNLTVKDDGGDNEVTVSVRGKLR